METPEQAASNISEKELSPGQTLTINASEQGDVVDAPAFYDPKQKCIAELTLGGADTEEGAHFDSQTVFVFRVTDQQDNDYIELARRAKAVGVEPTNFMLIATRYGGKGFAAGAFLSHVQETSERSRSIPTIGREGNIHWLEYGVVGEDQDKDPRWNPFDKNKSISRRQASFAVSDAEGNEITFMGVSDNSRTAVKANHINKSSDTVIDSRPVEQPAPTLPKKGWLAKMLKR